MGASIAAAIVLILKLGNLAMEERHRYEDNVLKLKEKWYEAFAKLDTPEGDDDLLDDIELKLLLTLEAVVEATGAKNP